MNKFAYIDSLKEKHEPTWHSSYGVFPSVLKVENLKIGVEVGVAFGGHAKSILEKTSVEKLILVDPYKHYKNYDDPLNLSKDNFDLMFLYAKKRLMKYTNRIKFIRDFSSQAKDIIKKQIDFVYLDANHSFEGVYEDLCVWFEKVRDGGVIGGHDYAHSNFPGVKRAVDKFFERLGWRVKFHDSGVWWVLKEKVGISFIIPCYNSEKFLNEAVDSIYKGNFNPGDEVIAVDDRSRDNTYKLLLENSKKRENFRVYKNIINRGGGFTRNKAVKNAQNNLIFCLDADNVLQKSSVDRLKKLLINTGSENVSFQFIYYFSKNINTISHKWDFGSEGIRFADQLRTYKIPSASGNYLYSKLSWKESGMYPEFAKSLDAWGFGLRQLARGYNFSILKGSFYYHRFGHDSYWRRTFSKGDKMSKIAFKLLKPYQGLIKEDDLKYIKEAKNYWLHNLEKRPIEIKSKDLSMK